MRLAELHQLSGIEKLRIIEALWNDLIRDDQAATVSPDWHAEELRKTEELFLTGKEEVLDWKIAKEEIRKRL